MINAVYREKRGRTMYSVIILCAGQGKRTGLNYNKMLYSFRGKTVYEMTLETFMNDTRCQQIIVVTRPEERKEFQQLLSDERIEFVDGGKKDRIVYLQVYNM